MNARFLRFAGLSFVLSATLLIGACHKKSVPVAPPQAPPPPAKPTATLTPTPESVQRGQSVQLTWSTQNATDVTIDSARSSRSQWNPEHCRLRIRPPTR